MSFIYGFLGALFLMLLLTAGVVVGWFGHRAFVRHSRPVLPDPGEKERQRLMEEQKAFRQLQNYSVERAYGMTGGDG